VAAAVASQIRRLINVRYPGCTTQACSLVIYALRIVGMKPIKHVIPNIGVKDIPLYPPADSIYQLIWDKNEVKRQNKLRHLGALTHAFPGARHYRWDYTVAMLFYCDQLRIEGVNSRFRIGRIEFSSAIAALQSVSLLWNLGHLPGTFSVEKGLYRFLYEKNPEEPARILPWPDQPNVLTEKVITAANRLLRTEDYRGLSRVLAVLKLMRFDIDSRDPLFHLLEDFIAPFFLRYDPPSTAQWPKLRQAFSLIRHLAYLTLDGAFTGLSWTPDVPALLQQTLAGGSRRLEQVASKISEVLSPIERATYESIYHAPDARRECALVARHTHDVLRKSIDPSSDIIKWLSSGLFRELALGRRIHPSRLARIADVRLRSHFASPSNQAVQIEETLHEKGFTHATVFHYRAYNSALLLEPDEIIIDAISRDPFGPDDIGKLLLWVISNIDDLDAHPKSFHSMLLKNDLEKAYIRLVARAIELRYRPMQLQVRPWPLAEYGLFPESPIADNRGAVWAANSQLDDRITRHILRDRRRSIPPRLRDSYAELLGLRELRMYLRRSWANRTEHRQRFLIMTASIRLVESDQTLIELDGALLRISTRSGRITLYGLETKTGGGNPSRTLARRAKALGIDGEILSLSNSHACIRVLL